MKREKLVLVLILMSMMFVLTACGAPRRVYPPPTQPTTATSSLDDVSREEQRRIKNAGERGEASERRQLIRERCYQGALEGANSYTEIYSGRYFAACEDAFQRGRLMRMKSAYANNKWQWYVEMQLAVMKEAEEAARNGDPFVPPNDHRFYDVAWNAYASTKAALHYRDMDWDRVREEIEYRCRSDALAGFPLTFYHPEFKQECVEAYERGLQEAPRDYYNRHQWRMKNHRPQRW